MTAICVEDAESRVDFCGHDERDTSYGCVCECQWEDKVDERTWDKEEKEPLEPPGDATREYEERNATDKGDEGG